MLFRCDNEMRLKGKLWMKIKYEMFTKSIRKTGISNNTDEKDATRIFGDSEEENDLNLIVNVIV